LTIYAWLYFWALDSVSLVSLPIFMPIHTVLMTIALNQEVVPFSFFLRTALAIWGLLWFHTNFRSIFSTSVKKAIQNLIAIALNL